MKSQVTVRRERFAVTTILSVMTLCAGLINMPIIYRVSKFYVDLEWNLDAGPDWPWTSIASLLAEHRVMTMVAVTIVTALGIVMANVRSRFQITGPVLVIVLLLVSATLVFLTGFWGLSQMAALV